nr:unnamed protein product [Digitaria exilis]
MGFDSYWGKTLPTYIYEGSRPEVAGVRLVGDGEYPALRRWAEEYTSDETVKRFLPDRDELVAFFAANKERYTSRVRASLQQHPSARTGITAAWLGSGHVRRRPRLARLHRRRHALVGTQPRATPSAGRPRPSPWTSDRSSKLHSITVLTELDSVKRAAPRVGGAPRRQHDPVHHPVPVTGDAERNRTALPGDAMRCAATRNAGLEDSRLDVPVNEKYPRSSRAGRWNAAPPARCAAPSFILKQTAARFGSTESSASKAAEAEAISAACKDPAGLGCHPTGSLMPALLAEDVLLRRYGARSMDSTRRPHDLPRFEHAAAAEVRFSSTMPAWFVAMCTLHVNGDLYSQGQHQRRLEGKVGTSARVLNASIASLRHALVGTQPAVTPGLRSGGVVGGRLPTAVLGSITDLTELKPSSVPRRSRQHDPGQGLTGDLSSDALPTGRSPETQNGIGRRSRATPKAGLGSRGWTVNEIPSTPWPVSVVGSATCGQDWPSRGPRALAAGPPRGASSCDSVSPAPPRKHTESSGADGMGSAACKNWRARAVAEDPARPRRRSTRSFRPSLCRPSSSACPPPPIRCPSQGQHGNVRVKCNVVACNCEEVLFPDAGDVGRN